MGKHKKNVKVIGGLTRKKREGEEEEGRGEVGEKLKEDNVWRKRTGKEGEGGMK